MHGISVLFLSTTIAGLQFEFILIVLLVNSVKFQDSLKLYRIRATCAPWNLIAQAASAAETSANKPIMAVFLTGESSSFLCLYEKYSEQAISVGTVKLPRFARNDKRCGACNYRKGGGSQRQYDRTSAFMGGGTGKVQNRSQPSTLHCPKALFPTATTVPSALSPTVCRQPAVTWTMFVQLPISHCP